MSYNTKTNCFAVAETIFTTQKDMLLNTKTNCFVVMMAYDAFAKKGHII